ncbi:MAG: SH3 domain-containing protein [Lachnospiraceae bacterium]|nr:SH3 domain-containing protein [Lachnospiraceae bacterium]
MMKELRKKITGLFVMLAMFVSVCGTLQVQAAEFSVTDSKAVLYSNDNTKVYRTPDENSGVVTTIASGLPVDVTGITSNGWFRISLNGAYYVPGYGLESRNSGNTNPVVNNTDVSILTKGTFSFFKNPQLGDFTKTEVEDMDENTYIKYLDSYLMGYALIENCILQDTGERLKTAYENEARLDKNVAGMTMQAYLINYRNNYLSDSLAGPFRSEKDLKLAMNRAIRYEISTFGAVYKSSNIGDSESKMTKLLEGVIDQMKAEQGVTFTCRMEYGDYKTGDGDTGKGWIIEFTRKK